MMQELTAVILAAGKGTRMNSDIPKVLHKVGGKPMLQYVLDAAAYAGAQKQVVVVGYLGEQVRAYIGDEIGMVEQREQLGTAHAVLQAKDELQDFIGTTMILCGDTPLVEGQELKSFYEQHLQSGAVASVFTAILDDATGYGRIVRDSVGNVLKIVEHKDATSGQLEIREINTGIYCVDNQVLFAMLDKVECNNAQGEFYLTDIIDLLVHAGQTVAAVQAKNADSTVGINSRHQLAQVESMLRERTLDRLMSAGVTIISPESTFIADDVQIGRDTVIYPFTWIEAGCTIGKRCQIGPNVRLQKAEVGNANVIHFTYAHEVVIGDNCNVGPFAHLRPGTQLGDDVKVGNFVEVKNSWVGEGSKLPHLSYIGDADLGSRVNMGCGTITVNYDGKRKSRTRIEDNAFVGCNSNLVAPVTVGEHAYVAAGSTITKDVPANALGVARAKQSNIDGWAAKK